MCVYGKEMTPERLGAAYEVERAMISRAVILIMLFFLLFAGTPAVGATSTITASMSFETLLSLTNLSGANLGYLMAEQAGTYTLSPAGGVTASGGGTWLGGLAQPASLTVVGSTTQGISISATNYISANGVTPSNATCSYDGGAAAACSLNGLAAPGTGKSL